MRSNRLGCLTGTGMLAALVTALAIAGYAYARGGLMYNPGPLNSQRGEMLGGVTSHAEAGGKCEACHTAPWESATMADRCTACHTNIAGQMRDVASIHGTLMHNNPNLGCRHCHPEHRGAEAQLTRMEDATFPHEALGFSLNGHQLTAARAPFTCDDCHHGDVATFALDSCDSCHRQMDLGFMTAHTVSFGSACLDCHDGVDRFDENFDHNIFSFKVTGKHVGVACVQCHVNARGFDDFEVTSQDCYSCHHMDDPHQGRFGAGCSRCHTEDGWSPAKFDHNLSSFPLTGTHMDVACEECHVNGQFEGLSTACVDCHAEPAYHAGQFGTDCAVCHSTVAWIPAEFNGQHTFPLNHGDGASCATCHPVSFAAYTCYGCHEHSEVEVRSEHLEEGIGSFDNCMECHPTGQEHEGGEDEDN
jgi:hypothetical protein